MIQYLVLVAVIALVLSKRKPRKIEQDSQPKSRSNYKRQQCYDEAKCTLVSSRGLMQLCDYFPQHPISSNSVCWIDETLAKEIPANSLVYVPTSSLQDFAQNVLPHMTAPFRLVSGDADESVLPTSLYLSIANHPLLQKWFSQNLELKHPKCANIPIGLDYHTQAFMAAWGSKTSRTATLQERILMETRAKAKLWKDRKTIAFANFQFNMQGGYYTHDRREAAALLDRNVLESYTNRLDRDEAWKIQVKCKFVISPHGHGLDCHRTWEALCLGCVPIVKTSQLDSFYSKLPILIVNSWKDVTLDLMERYAEKIERCPSTHEMLRLDYWRKVLRE